MGNAQIGWGGGRKRYGDLLLIFIFQMGGIGSYLQNIYFFNILFLQFLFRKTVFYKILKSIS